MLERFELREDNMRRRPGLQLADLFAFSHSNIKTHNDKQWHQMVMGIEQDELVFTYDLLLTPVASVIEKRKLWKLPKRRTTK
jgi:hypothetical protein